MTSSRSWRSAREFRGPRGQRGLSLLELMIAATLGLVVLAGVSQIFVSTNAASRTQAAIVTLQENGRFASERLKPIGRLAGRMAGCVVPPTAPTATSPGNVRFHLDIPADEPLQMLFDPTLPIVAWEFVGTGVGDTYALAAPAAGSGVPGDWVTFRVGGLPPQIASRSIEGSDVVVMKRARAIPNLTACTGNLASDDAITMCDETGTATLSGILRKSIVLVTDCTGYDIFQNTAGTDGDADGALTLERSASAADMEPGNVAGNWFSSYGNTMQVLAVDNIAYYVGVNAGGEPALYELNMGGGADAEPVELIEGVESMQVMLGELDLATNQVVYREPQDVTDARLVMSARVALLMRADGPDALRDTETYGLAGVTIDPVDDTRVRRVFEVTMNMRNNGALL